MSLRTIVVGVFVVMAALAPRSASAYPQFQLSRDATCTGCHIAPAGGGLLTENGYNVAESISKFGHAPELFYGKWDPPKWLALGGDFRALGGLFVNPFKSAAAFPMQGDLYAHGTFGAVSVQITAGLRPAQEGNEAATYLWSREHYVMWQQKPDESNGLYVRIGRFMPVFGLRLAEHPAYTRRFGGTPLYYDTYGAAVEYIDPDFEVHATGFIRDRLIDAVGQDSGGALYAEYRAAGNLSFGVESMATVSKDDAKLRGGLTAKVYVDKLATIFQAEAIVTDQHIQDSVKQVGITGQLLASRFMTEWLLLDVGVGIHDPSFDVARDDRMAFDGNLHWFVDSHFELILNSRLEQFGFGKGGPVGGYALLQAHYRL